MATPADVAMNRPSLQQVAPASKPLHQSRTIWACVLFPIVVAGAQAYSGSHPLPISWQQAVVQSALGVALRIATNQSVRISGTFRF